MEVGLSIIVVNWNGGELLRRAVQSVLTAPPSVDFEIVVVDNASTDKSIELLRSGEGVQRLIGRNRFRIVENADNRGFGQANNQAFSITDTPLLLLLNPDTEVTPGSIDSLIATVLSAPRIGAAGPRMLNADGSLQLSVWRNPPAAWEILFSQLKLYLLLPQRIRGELLLGGHWAHDRERQVPMLGAAAILVRREVIDTIGGFDERFHMYGEDNEWCLRMFRGGWKLVFQPQAVILHHGAQSSLQRWTNLEKMRVQLEANYFFQEQSLPRHRLIANQLASYLTASAQHAWRRLRGMHAPAVLVAKQMHRAHLQQALQQKASSRRGSDVG